MSQDDRWIPPEAWKTVVDSVPLVSVDLIIKYEGGVLLGLRENEPAKGEWFVPGGTVLKNERLTEAVHRVAEMEVGCDVEIQEQLGVFEHFYDTSDVDGVDSKHYVANGFVVEPIKEQLIEINDSQHSQLRVAKPPFDNLHPYVQRYLEQITIKE
jgi:colanic acid biosynthesis protein WcaH